jgi:hypothetical protein
LCADAIASGLIIGEEVMRNTWARRFAGFGALAAAATLAMGTLSATAVADTSLDGPGDFKSLISRHSGKCLDVKSRSTANGAQIIQWRCHGGTNQQWGVVPTDDDYLYLVAANSGKCLDVEGGSQDNGANVIQWTCHGGPNQQWKRTDTSNGYFTLTAKHSEKCLDVKSGSTANGAQIIQWTCHGGPNQQWKNG